MVVTSAILDRMSVQMSSQDTLTQYSINASVLYVLYVPYVIVVRDMSKIENKLLVMVEIMFLQK